MKTTTPTVDPVLRRKCHQALRDMQRRAAADRQVITYTARDLEALALRAGGLCHYCKTILLGAGWQFDHARPTARVADYSLANIRVACPGCNSAKGQLNEGEYLALLALVRTLDPRAGTDLLRRLRSGGQRYSVSRRRKGGPPA
jgi:5-methylcytosine-specific restriction endonuclease McrA